MPENITQSVGLAYRTVVGTFARPANATPYTAGDVISNSVTTTVLLKFLGIVRLAGGSGEIIKARLHTDLKTEIAQCRLYLYTKPETSVSVPVDNLPDTTIYANKAFEIGYLDFPALAAAADSTNNTGARAEWSGFASATAPSGPLAYVCDSTLPLGETAIYGKLVNITGTTPASAQNWWVELTVRLN